MFKHQPVPIINEMSRNSVADFKDYHLSHDRSTGLYGCETTALVMKNTVFFILRGDHRDAMHAAAEKDGLQGCFDYYLENLDQAHEISEHHNVVADNDKFDIASNALLFLGADNISRLKEAAEKLETDQ